MRSIAAQITALAKGWFTRPGKSDQILHLLRRAPAGSLDKILKIVDIPEVIRSLRDRDFGLRSDALDFLLRERVHELSDDTLAAVISALHKGPTPRRSQEAIVEVLTSRNNDDFLRLKSRINNTADHHNLEHLVFEDLDEDLAERLLAHIAAESNGQGRKDLRILCDIDDTLKSAIHDRRYPRGTIYPGVVSFLHHLDDGAAEAPDRPGDLTFVTARPEGPRGLIEQYTRGSLDGLGLPPHTVMGGSVLNLHTRGAIKDRKLENMRRNRELFPDARTIFIGDSGQADGEVGAEAHRRHPGHIVGTLLHNVTDVSDKERADWAVKGVYVFDTYAGAAAHALQLGLIRKDQALAIAEDVRFGLETFSIDREHRSRLMSLLEEDIRRIEATNC